MFSLLFHLKLWLIWRLFHFGIVLPVLLINAVINRTDPCHLLLVTFTILKLFFNKWVKKIHGSYHFTVKQCLYIIKFTVLHIKRVL